MPPRKKAAAKADGPSSSASSSASWLTGKGLWLTLGVPVLLAIIFQYILNNDYPGTLEIEPNLQTQECYELGDFEIRWENGLLSVWPKDEPDRKYSLWHTPSDRTPFLMAANSEVDGDPIQDGHYFLKEKIREKTTVQTVDTIQYPGPHALIITGELKGPTIKIPYILSFSTDSLEPKGKLRFSASLDTLDGVETEDGDYLDQIGSVNRIFLRYGTEEDEGFFGFGQHYSRWNLKGSRVPILISEQGVGRGLQPLTFALNWFLHGVGSNWHTTYVAKPIYMTSHMRSLILDSPKVFIFDLTKPKTVTVEHWSTGINGMILSATDPLELVRLITTETGRMNPLPDWTQSGVIVGLEGGSTEVENITHVLLQEKVPLVGVWLQDWVGTRHDWDGTRLIWNWEVNRGYYPRWDELHEEMARHGVRLLTYINPYLVDVQDKFPHTRNLFREAMDNGYLVKNMTGHALIAKSGSIEFGTIDATNPATRTWLKDVIIKNMIEAAGSSGWMADFGEYIPFQSKLYAGPGHKIHNVFPNYWASLQREAIQEAGGGAGDILAFVRSGHIKTPGVAQLYWVGDQLVTWDCHDGIKTVLLSMLSGGITGHSLTHSDVGGYTMIDHALFKFFRSRELLFRWVEMGAFAGAIYRTHLGSFMHTPSAQVWDDVETIQHFARFGRVFAALASYRQVLMEEAAVQGYPLIRPLFLHFPQDALVYTLPFQFLLGEDLLVAPVLDPGVKTAKVYLPAVEGGWIHVWTNRMIGLKATEGEWVTVPAEIGQPPVFYRHGSPYQQVFEQIPSQ